MLIALSISILSFASIVFFSRRLFRYLYHFQDFSYSKEDFRNWLVTNGIYDKKGSGIATIAALIIEITKEQQVIALVVSSIAAISIIWLAFWEPDPRKTGSTRLQPTKQAIKIYNLTFILHSFFFILAILATYAAGIDDDIACYWLIAIVFIQSSPIWMFLASNIIKKLKQY